MANVLTGNPIVADTAGVLSTGQLYIIAIQWVGCSAPTNQVILNNSQGNLVFTGLGSDIDQAFGGAGFQVNGLTLQQIDSGKLLIYTAFTLSSAWVQNVSVGTLSYVMQYVQQHIDRSDINPAMITFWINNRQRKICQLENTYVLEKTASPAIVTALGVQNYFYPADYKDEMVVSLNDNGQRRQLTKLNGTQPERQWTDLTMQAMPLYYFLWTTQYSLYPIPDQAYPLILRYYCYLADLVNSTDSNEFTVRFPDMLITGTLAEAYAYLHEEDRAKYWEQKFITEVTGDRTTQGYLPFCMKRIRSNPLDNRIRVRMR